MILCQPGYSGYRGERQKIYLVHEYELSAVAGILAIIVRLERTQKNLLFRGRSGYMSGNLPVSIILYIHPYWFQHSNFLIVYLLIENKFNTELLAEKNPPCTKNEVVNGQLI